MSRERFDPSEHCADADALFDALGFGGEGGRYEADAVLLALHEFAHEPRESDGIRGDVDEWLLEIYRNTKDYPKDREDEVASSVLGMTVAHKIARPLSTLTKSQSLGLIDRSYQAIRLTRESYGLGNEQIFYRKFQTMISIYGKIADRPRQLELRKLLEHADKGRASRREAKPMRLESKTSWGQHLMRGMAIIAMKDAYLIQPPEDQRDENGAWQLPHERDDEDNV